MPPKLQPTPNETAIRENIAKLSKKFPFDHSHLNVSVFGLAGSGKSSFLASVLFATGSRESLPAVKNSKGYVTYKFERYFVPETCIRLYDIYGLDRRVTPERFLKAMKGQAKIGHSFLDDGLLPATPDEQSENQIDACIVFIPVNAAMMSALTTKDGKPRSEDDAKETIKEQLKKYWEPFFFSDYVKRFVKEGIPITIFLCNLYKIDKKKVREWRSDPVFMLIVESVRNLLSEFMDVDKASQVKVAPGVFYDQLTLQDGLAYDPSKHGEIADQLLDILANQVLRSYLPANREAEEAIDPFKYENSIPVAFAGKIDPNNPGPDPTSAILVPGQVLSCPNCGRLVKKGKFCEECGTKVEM